MKKCLKRFIIILILITMVLEIVLPMNTYAINDISFTEDYYYSFTVEETTWYEYDPMFDPDGYFYYDSSDKVYATTRTRWAWIESGIQNIIPRRISEIYLVTGIVYYSNEPPMFITKSGGTIEEQLKSMIAKFMYSIANGLHYLVGKALGETVTIDDLVFNNYSETNISYFDNKEDVEYPSDLIYGNDEVGGLNSVVNKWYSIFIKIALMGYMVILVYMGIRILLTSTADKKADYKKLFIDWIIGLAILFLFPYVMKYMIKINESFVQIIEENKGYEDKVSSALNNVNYDKNFTEIYIDNEIDWSTGNDYMSLIAFEANRTNEPALALAFLIMTWQLIALVFHYYKRLFMIAFLIIIFPLVGLSYAIDKIADGKSQAFNTWAKEFMLNVFVQTFHAIVYVFCCSTIYSSSGTESAVGYDFILIIVGVTFLFKGEEIIRQIFGQVSRAGTMKSLSDSAAATFAKFKITEGAIKKIGEYTVGRKSIASKLKRGADEGKALNARSRAFDKTATTPEDYNIGARLEHAPKPPPENASEEEKKNFLKEREIYNAAAVFNNPNSHSYAEKARALNTLKKVATENPNHDVFKDTKATAGQILAIATLDNDIQGMARRGMNKVDIEREVTARLGIIFAGETEQKQKDRVNTYFTSLYLNGNSSSVSKKKIKREVNEIIKEIEDIQKSIVFADDEPKDDKEKEDIDDSILNDAIDIYQKYEDELSEEDKDVAKQYAVNVAILKERNSGAFTEEELLEAAIYVKEHENDNDVTKEMADEDFGIDTDVFMHTLAKEVVEKSNSDEVKEFAQEVVKDYEENARNGYFDDEISVHQIMKDMKNEEEVDRIIEEIYQNKKKAMKDATEEIAKEYLTDNRVEITKGSYDTTRRTQDGDTEAEILAKKIDVIGRTLSNLVAINKESASEDSGAVGILGWIMKEYLARKEEERTGITRSMEDRKNIYDPTVSTQDFIEKNKTERDRIQNEHFMGDIGDRKE